MTESEKASTRKEDTAKRERESKYERKSKREILGIRSMNVPKR